MRPRDLGVVDGVLAVGSRVEDAADAIDGLGDLLRRRALRRALEAQVLDEVRDAGLALGLVARAGADVDAHRDRARVRHRRGDHAQAVIEGALRVEGFGNAGIVVTCVQLNR